MTTLKHYKQEIAAIPGNDMIKAKTFIEQNINSWCLDQEGLLIDLLDATHLTAFDVLDVLEGIAESEPDHVDFHNAVLALRVTLAQKHLKPLLAKAEDLHLVEEVVATELPFADSHLHLAFAG